MKLFRNSLAGLLCVLALGGAALRKPPRTPKVTPPAAPQKPIATDTLAAAPLPADSIASAWADSALAAVGGADAWLLLSDLSYNVRVTQRGTGGANRDSDSRHYLKLFPGGASLRIDTKTESGHVVQAACVGEWGWLREEGRPSEDASGARYACQQRQLEEWLLCLPQRLAFDREDLRRAAEPGLDGRPLVLLDFEPGLDGNLWRVGLDSETHLPAVLMWWHFARGDVPPEARLVPSDYRREAGLLFPRHWVLWSGDGRRKLNEYEIGDLQLNRGLADSLFTGR